eukprot:GEMP01094511.1.p1 GENE.GEMP01094511.1~~GEMP01094511.1.p1  ORF type:complete len:182 (+),score=37.64 GEMP01094511.1:54-599(+)
MAPHAWRKVLIGGSAVAAAALLGLSLYKARKKQREQTLLAALLGNGPKDEATIDIVVKNPDADEYNFSDNETIEIPIGLLLECSKLKDIVCKHLDVNQTQLIERIHAGSVDAIQVSNSLEFLSLVQLTYWYDRRMGPTPLERLRKTEAKFGRWTAKIPREQIIYSAVALKSDPLSHLGQPV